MSTIYIGEPIPNAISREQRRYRLNRLIESRYRRNGVVMYSDLDVEDAIAFLEGRTPPSAFYGPSDEEVIAKAVWNDPVLLTDYLDGASAVFQRDYNQYGVYVWFEIVDGHEVPVLVEAVPKYVGMSTILSSRLRFHARGESIPAQRVVREHLQHVSKDERAEYAGMDRPEQRRYRQRCMEQRGLWVRTAHTASKLEARQLEAAMIRHYEGQGYDLWNILKLPWHG